MSNEAERQAPLGSYRNVPLTFVENAGQTREGIRYLSHRPGCQFGFSSEEILLVFAANTPERREGMALSLRFLGANPNARIEGQRQESGKAHYFIGNDPSKWRTGLPTYREIVYRELWPGVDLVFHGENGTFKYDVVVKPGARLGDIRFAYSGADGLSLSEDGHLQIRTAHGVLTEERPVSYQMINGRKVPVDCRFLLPDGPEACVYGFEAGNGYRLDHELVIDPTLAYSTYLGGSDTDIGFGIAVDGLDNAYVTGQTLSLDFPITPGAFQPFKDGSSSVFVTKVNPGGTSLAYSTFLGGSSFDLGRGIAVDPSGHAYVTGQTLSPDFPTTPGAFQTFIGGAQDAFVTKLSPDGGSLVYSTFLGGEGVDTGFGIAVDSAGSAYVTGGTSSVNFPTVNAVQGFIANEHVFVTKLNPAGSALEYSTLLGGHGIDEGRGIAVDGAGEAYAAGLTTSQDFPTTPGAFQIALTGVISAFVTKLDVSGTVLLYSTFLGGSGDDEARGIAVDEFGQAYVTGSTTSPDFPPTPGSFQPFYGGGASDAFVTKLSPDGTYQVYSTFLGGGESDAGNGIAVRADFAYVTGSTGSFNFPITPDAFQPFLQDGGDAFLTQFNVMGNELVFSTFIGGSSSDVGNAVAVDNAGCIFLTGQTFSPNFPVTPGAFQPFLRGGSDAFVIRICLSLGTTVKKFPDRFEVARGEQVTYTIEIQNPSAATLTNVVVQDPLLGIFEVIPAIPPFSVHIIQFVFTVPLDQPFGIIRNVVSVTSDQFGEPLESESEILVTGTPVLIAAKTVNPPAALPGETVTFTITLENHGDADLINVHIVDPLIGLDQFIGDIPPGGIFVIDWPFVIPPDAQAGLTIANFVTITADNLPQPEEVGTVVEVLPAPRLEIFKSADRNVVFPGEIVHFTIEVVNTGNTELTNVHVIDDLTGFEVVIPVLFPGQSEIFSVPFFVSLEMPPQTYINTATATSDQTEEPVFASTEITVPAEPRLGILKIPETTSVVPGQTIRYTVILENIGNVPLTGIRILDPVLGIDEFVPDLAVGEVRELVFTFTIPRESPIGSNIVNFLTVETAETGLQEVESVITVTGFGLSLLKEADRATALPGDTIVYTLTVTNLLDTPQTNVVLIDELLGLNETIPVLQANETIVRTIAFTVPETALPGSIIRNTFIAESDQTPPQETIADVVVVTPPGPGLLLHKVPDRNTAAPGDTITYTLTVTNLFSIPQTNVVLIDELLGLNETIPFLPANETITLTLTFTVPADAVPGTVIRNTFIASSDQSPESETISEVVVQEPPGPALLIQKVPDRNAAAPGDTITYTLTVTNLLDVPQTNVVLTDELLGLSETIAVLPANATITRTVTFTVPADAVPGSVIRNTFVVSSDQSPPVETVDEMTVQPSIATTLAVRKLPDRSSVTPGDTIRYTVEVTNTGANPATNVVIRDSLTGQLLAIPVIAPGETARVSFEFTVPAGTAAGIVIANRVTVTWTEQPPGSLPVEDEARVTVADPAELPEVEVEAQPETPRPGQPVTKTITVTNVTSITLTNVRVFDQLLGFRTVIPSLAPGESRVFTLQLPIPPGTQGGTEFRNTVSVVSDETPLQQEEVIVQTQQLPDASLVMTVNPATGRPGDRVIFTIQACNTGNVPLLNVRLTVPLLRIQVRIASLEVGACETLRIPFILPEVEEDTVIVARATLVSDNGPTREASASVKVIPEEEE